MNDLFINTRSKLMEEYDHPKKIISGGQTGADQAGLFAAADMNLQTGGWIPKGFRTSAGSAPMMAKSFGMIQHKSRNYPARTRLNVRDSDGTVVFGNVSSPGSKLTLRLCTGMRKPNLVIPTPPDADTAAAAKVLESWLRTEKIKTLNVAGNREETNPGIYGFTYQTIRETLQSMIGASKEKDKGKDE